MSRADLPVPRLLAEIHELRGRKDDEDWATAVVGRLLLDDATEERAVEALTEVRDALATADSAESAGDLMGDPHEWARAREEQWREDGVPAADTAPAPARDTAIIAMIASAVFAGLFAVGFLISGRGGETTALGHVLLPGALGLLSAIATGVFGRVRPARGQTIAVITCVLTVIVGAAATAAMLALTNPIRLAGPVPLGELGAMVGYSLLAWIIARIWPEAAATPPEGASLSGSPAADEIAPPALTDDAWAHRLTMILRSRGDMTERRVATIVAEARSHAQAAGSTLVEQFSSPESYAARFPRDERVPRRRAAWWATGCAVAVGAFAAWSYAHGDDNPWAVGWCGICAIVAAIEWRRVLRADSSTAQGS